VNTVPAAVDAAAASAAHVRRGGIPLVTFSAPAFRRKRRRWCIVLLILLTLDILILGAAPINTF
jgi:hypothetical protein